MYYAFAHSGVDAKASGDRAPVHCRPSVHYVLLARNCATPICASAAVTAALKWAFFADATEARLARFDWTESSSSCCLTVLSVATGCVAIYIQLCFELCSFGPVDLGLCGGCLRQSGVGNLQLCPRLVKNGQEGTRIDLEKKASCFDQRPLQTVLPHQIKYPVTFE